MKASRWFSRVVVCAFAAVCAAGAWAGQVPVTCVQKGLVALYDGIYNATNAAGEPVHDASFVGLVDFVSGHDLTLEKGTSYEFAADHLRLNTAVSSTDGTTFSAAHPEIALAYTNRAFTLEMHLVNTGHFNGGYTMSFGQKDISNRCLSFYDWSNKAYDGIMVWDKSGASSGVADPGLDKHHTVTFVAEGGTSYKFYIDGELKKSLTKTQGTLADNVFALGGGHISGGMTEPQSYYSIRAYNRVLGADEIALNRAYDRVRFEGVSVEDAFGYGWRMSPDGEVQCRVRVISNRDVACDDLVALRGANDYWIAGGSACTLKASPVAVDERLGWCGVPTGGTFDDLTQTATFTVSRPATIRVEHFRPTHIWTGEADTDFFNAENWVDTSGIVTETAPAGEASVVYVPTGLAAYPVATNAISVGDFRIGSLTNGAGWATFMAQTLQTNVVAGACVVYSGGRLEHAGNSAEMTYVLNVDVGGDMTVGAGGEVNVNGKGYSAGKGPGGWNAYLTGGTYAGTGYNRSVGKYPPYYYGSSRRPTDLGSGGQGGKGGGCIRLDVAGALTVEGTLTSNGGPGPSSGSGSGGSIWVLADALEGSGFFYAESGTGYGASGGRIAICQRSAADLEAFSKGTFGYGNGTLYLENALDEPGRGELKVAKPTSGNTDATVLDVTVDDASEPYGRVTVESGGNLSVLKGVTLRVTKAVAAAGTLASATDGGTLELMPFAGAEMTVSGTLSFHTVIATNGDSTVRFADGAKVTVRNDGAVWLGGEKGHLTTLLAPSAWELSIGERVDAVIQHVAASNSNASAAKVSDLGGKDLGGNVNWEFPREPEPGDTIFWTGNGTADWGIADNWTDECGGHRLPLKTDRVVIGADAAPYPVVTASKSVLSFTVAEGAAFTLNGADLTVAEYLVCTGTLTCCGSETISVGGAISFADGTFVRGMSTFVLAGAEAAAQSADFSGCELYNLVVQAPAASFARGFSAYSFACEQPRGVALVFGAGELFDFTKLRLVPAAGASLTLDSTVMGSSWRLKAGAGALCDGVSVRDCDASPGNAICTRGFIDRTNNANWRDGAVRWLGNGTAWADEANWEGGVPTNTSDVLIGPSANNPVLGKATGIRSLTVNGDGASVQLKLNAELSVSEFAYVGQGATVVADQPMSVTNDFLIAAGGKLTHTKGSGKVDLFVGGSMTIDVGGSVDVDMCGYGAGGGPGGNGAYLCTGSYGGRGTGGKPCYGSIRRPVDYGSGGQSNGGGGAVRLTVENDLVVNGGITARSYQDTGNGTGSGGSIWLTVGKLLGGVGGVISAKSAEGKYPGGGGRISLVQTKATDISAYEGLISAGAVSAGVGPGTLYVENADDEPDCGELIVDGCDKSPTLPCELGTSVTDATVPFKKITVRNTGRLTMSGGVLARTLGDFEAAGGTVTAAVPSGLEILPRRDAVTKVSGTIGVGAFVCTNSAGTLEFAKGTVVTVATNGLLNLNGQVDRGLRLKSSEDGQPWYLTVGAGSTMVAKCLDVSDSDASGGEEIAARRSVGKRARNVHWKFKSGMAMVIR